MADQLNMGGLNLGDQGSTVRSYIPPHMRGKMPNGANPTAGPGPVPGPGPGPVPGPAPAAAAMNGLNNSAWAG
jgi:ATP-dependent RNA helicase DDX3X